MSVSPPRVRKSLSRPLRRGPPRENQPPEYDSDAPLTLAMPRLVSDHRDRYGTMTLHELAEELHRRCLYRKEAV